MCFSVKLLGGRDPTIFTVVEILSSSHTYIILLTSSTELPLSLPPAWKINISEDKKTFTAKLNKSMKIEKKNGNLELISKI